MKTTLFLSSIFFLLGLKVSSLINLHEKASTVDQIISTKIMNSKPINAVPFFKDSKDIDSVKDDNVKKDTQKEDSETQINQ